MTHNMYNHQGVPSSQDLLNSAVKVLPLEQQHRMQQGQVWQSAAHYGPPSSNPPTSSPCGRMGVTMCAHCKTPNLFVEIEIEKLDVMVENLTKERDMFHSEVKRLKKELEAERSRNNNYQKVSSNRPSESINPLHKPLSPEATEFSPKRQNDVPVVSAKTSMSTNEAKSVCQPPDSWEETLQDKKVEAQVQNATYQQDTSLPKNETESVGPSHDNLGLEDPGQNNKQVDEQNPNHQANLNQNVPDIIAPVPAGNLTSEADIGVGGNREDIQGSSWPTSHSRIRNSDQDRRQSGQNNQHYSKENNPGRRLRGQGNSRRGYDQGERYQRQDTQNRPRLDSDQENRQHKAGYSKKIDQYGGQNPNFPNKRVSNMGNYTEYDKEGGNRSIYCSKDNETEGPRRPRDFPNKESCRNDADYDGKGKQEENSSNSLANRGKEEEREKDEKSEEDWGNNGAGKGKGGQRPRDGKWEEGGCDYDAPGRGKGEERHRDGRSKQDDGRGKRDERNRHGKGKQEDASGPGRGKGEERNRDGNNKHEEGSGNYGPGRGKGEEGHRQDQNNRGKARQNLQTYKSVQQHSSRSHQNESMKDGARERKPLKNLIKEVKGDLFSAPTEFSLAHCVASDFRMGSGIAVRFKKEFRRTGELLDQNEGVGGCAFLEDKPNSRYIFYLVTKSVSSGKPTYESFSKSLVAWKNKCQQLAVTKVAIPHIGCGLDRLDWDRVKDYINSTFENTNIEICAYDFNAEGLPEAEGTRPSGGVRVAYKIMNLNTIDDYTAVLFFGTEDGHIDSTAKSLDEKFHFIYNYKSAQKSLGNIVRYESRSGNYLIFALIVSKTFTKKQISFVTLEKCCREVSKCLRKDQYSYVGLECLSEWSDDDTFTEKTVTLLRNILNRPIEELWVCYRNEKEDVHKMCERYASKQPLPNAADQKYY